MRPYELKLPMVLGMTHSSGIGKWDKRPPRAYGADESTGVSSQVPVLGLLDWLQVCSAKLTLSLCYLDLGPVTRARVDKWKEGRHGTTNAV